MHGAHKFRCQKIKILEYHFLLFCINIHVNIVVKDICINLQCFDLQFIFAIFCFRCLHIVYFYGMNINFENIDKYNILLISKPCV